MNKGEYSDRKRANTISSSSTIVVFFLAEKKKEASLDSKGIRQPLKKKKGIK